MNKILKYTLIGLGATSIIFTTISNFCDAGAILYGEMRADETRTNTSYISRDLGDGGCFRKHVAGGTIYWKVDGTEYSTTHGARVYCGTGTVDVKTSSSSYGYKVFTGIKLIGPQGCPTCQTCDDPYTSLECQTEYNLIPISSVTQSYCELNYNLIDPSTCPVSEGTGVVNWSSLFINNTQYAGNDNIEILIPDFIGWSIIYNTGTNYIDIEGYNADTEYIETIINNEKLTPTPEDFSKLMVGLTEFIPYLFIGLLIFFMVRIFNKIWK